MVTDAGGDGHLYGFGNTEEAPGDLRTKILGRPESGRKSDGNRFDPKTGKGYVPAVVGAYDDALRVKGNKVVTAIFELSGAACPAFAAHRRKIARQVKEGGAAARDNTAYSPNPKNTRNFLTHHTQRQALAATRANAKHMLIEADALKAHALLYHTSGAARANAARSATI